MGRVAFVIRRKNDEVLFHHRRLVQVFGQERDAAFVLFLAGVGKWVIVISVAALLAKLLIVLLGFGYIRQTHGKPGQGRH